ncbi:MAG: nucleoside hydrolase [Defluviitaleaceae bacterium]|nr:nucleoside hydrolase [Defluviitaleaceae bacterium]
MSFNYTFLEQQLRRPTGPIDVVLDTDAYNEIDDQYAIAYLLASHPFLRTEAIYAAPFFNHRSTSPEDGMERSYHEILNITALCGRKDIHKAVYRGSTRYLPDEETPVESEAARDLVVRAMAHSRENPLYVLAIGAITNVASALLMEPAIVDRIVIVFLGGHAHHLPPLPEFNMMQDIAAGRVVFGSGAPLIQLPCWGVVSHLTTTEPELRQHIKGKSALGDYLYDVTCKAAIEDGGNNCWSRVIWDISVVAWLLSDDFAQDATIPAPIPSYDNGYVQDSRRHIMKAVYSLNRDAIFKDLFEKIAAFGDTH